MKKEEKFGDFHLPVGTTYNSTAFVAMNLCEATLLNVDAGVSNVKQPTNLSLLHLRMVNSDSTRIPPIVSMVIDELSVRPIWEWIESFAVC